MRAAVLGNGRLSLGLDADLRLRELFWPQVGLLNHLQEGRQNRLLLWRPGGFSDLPGERFAVSGHYEDGMSFAWELEDRDSSLKVTVSDCLDPYLPVWARNIAVDPGPGEGPLALYSVQAYALGENTIGEEAVWDPRRRRLYHFKGPYWVAIRMGETALPRAGPATDRVAVAKVRDGGVQFVPGSGEVRGLRVDHGLIQSAVGLYWPSAGRVGAHYLLAFGCDREEADRNLDEAEGWAEVRSRSVRYWGGVAPQATTSLKVLASHCDSGGGVVAACDTDIQGDYRDHYRYVWPRDAAMCCSALLHAGLPDYAQRYLGWCAGSVDGGGFFWQRYRVDGTRGSGWHPWTLPEGELPVQEDETALSLVLAGEYLQATNDLERLHRVYPQFVRRSASFLLDYRQEDGRLVRPSYDLWEERRGVFSFTQAACAGALAAASRIAESLGHLGEQSAFEDGAEKLLEGLVIHLSDEERGYCRAITGRSGGDCRFDRDWTDDSSLYLIPLVLPAPDDAASTPHEAMSGVLATALSRSRTTWRRLKNSLAVPLPGRQVGGYARYSGDWYGRPVSAHGIPGNPWPVTTAWFALAGLRLGELEPADMVPYLEWFRLASSPSGMLPEQLDCVSGEPRSVTPLAWSHAMYLELLSAASRAKAGESGTR